MLLEELGGTFSLMDLPKPALTRVHACGVCRTDLHVVDGDIRDGRYPIVPGQQIVGTVEAVNRAKTLEIGMCAGLNSIGV